MDRHIIKGVVWSGIERFSVQIIQFVVSIILARILSPSDFGTVAIILVFINILQVFNETGFSNALIYKLDRDELDFSTIFFFNILWGLILYVILYFSAPLISIFFKIYELKVYTRILGLNILITSFVVVQRTKLYISVDFKTQAKASLISILVSGIISIYLAYRGTGAMAIIIQYLINNSINTISLWIYTKWKPKIQFSFKRFQILFNYAYKLIFARFINAIFQEIYSITIGKFYTPSQLGYFNRAKSFVGISSNNIINIVQRVSTPLLCEAQENNKNMENLLLGFIQKTAFIVYPLLSAVFVLAEPLIKVFITDKWLPAVWILKVLCPVGMMFLISTFNLNIFNATGKTNWALKSEVIKKSINILIIIIAIFVNFKALIYSQLLIAIIELFIDLVITKKQIGLKVISQLNNIKDIFLGSFTMALFVKILINFISNDIIKLLLGISSGVISYVLISYLFNIASFKTIANDTIKKMRHN